MKKVEVSVVMAEYNTRLDDLKEAISSILHQTFKNFELIIVDDGGMNDLEALAKEFDDKRIKIIKNPKNMGFVYSLNNGIKHAQADYIVRMDTDDIALPQRIETIYNFIKENPSYDVVGSKAIEFSGGKKYGTLGKAGEKTKKSIMRGDTMIHPSVIIKKASLLKAGGYRNYHRAEDLALWCEILLQGGKLFTLDEALLLYRVNPDDYKKRKLKNRKGEIKARLYFYPKLGAGPMEYLRVLKSIGAGILPSWLVRLYRQTFILKDQRHQEDKEDYQSHDATKQ